MSIRSPLSSLLMVFAATTSLSGAGFAADQLKPRAQITLTPGTERSLGTLGFWLPLSQDQRRVIYADLRATTDDDNNDEGNIGLGYRQDLGRVIAGGYAFYDHRRTARGTPFNQATVGAELLARDWDVRLNGYIPYSDAKEYAVTPGGGGATSAGFSGTGIVVNTLSALLYEEAQKGFDAELGWRVPLFEDKIDSIRVHGAGFHFKGDRADDITGWRARLTADAADWLSVGARWQNDNVRGSQGFFDLTFRFPGKARLRDRGLYARMDETPERDIDIVSASVVERQATSTPVLNAATGAVQKVYHVNNTAAPGGDGSAERPFNTLTAVSAVAGARDIIYVHAGDGTTTGMNTGITIDDAGQRLIGSAAGLVYDSGVFSTASGILPSGLVIAAPTTARPVITNVNVTSDAVSVTADDALITGIGVQNATRDGVRITNADRVTIDNVLATANTGTGINGVYSTTGARTITVRNSTSNNSGGNGILFTATGAGVSLTPLAENNSVTGAGIVGIRATAATNGVIQNPVFQNNAVSSTTVHGIALDAATVAFINNAVVRNNIVQNAGSQGIVANSTAGTIGNVLFSGNTVRNSTFAGLMFSATNATARVSGVMDGNISSGNGQSGLYAVGATNGEVSSVVFRNNYTDLNVQHGIFVFASSGGSVLSSTIDRNYIQNVTASGVRCESNGVGSTLTGISITNNDSVSSDNHGFLLYSLNNGSLSNATLSANRSSESALGGVTLLLTTGTMSNIRLDRNTSRNNTGNGLFIQDTSPGTDFSVVDVGGGALGSQGGNRFFSNTLQEVRVDMDGQNLLARGNWWGNPVGLTGGETSLVDASTIDSSGFLSADPGE